MEGTQTVSVMSFISCSQPFSLNITTYGQTFQKTVCFSDSLRRNESRLGSDTFVLDLKTSSGTRTDKSGLKPRRLLTKEELFSKHNASFLDGRTSTS